MCIHLARGPDDFKCINFRVCAETDFKRQTVRRTETASTTHFSVDETITNTQCYFSTDPVSITLDTNEFQIKIVVPDASILVEEIVPLVSDKRTAHGNIDVNITIRIGIAKCYAVSFPDVAQP